MSFNLRMTDKHRLFSMAFILLLGLTTSTAARNYTITIDGVKYAPSFIEVVEGDVIIWKNRDPFPHTVTAMDRQFDSGEMPAGGDWQWTPKKTGGFPYFCTLHPAMQGTVIVKKAKTDRLR